MLLIRIIDWCVQLVIMAGIILLRLADDVFGATILLGCLGCWQVAGAAINTYSFIQSGLSKKIRLYWLFTTITLLLMFSNISIYISGAGIACAGFTATWYAVILKQLIDISRYKKTIHGLIKK